MDTLRPTPGPDERRDLGFRPATSRDLWRALNASRSVDGAAVRYASLTMLIFYAVGAVLRPMPNHPMAFWVRCAVCAYVAIGVLFGPRFSWRALRLFTVGLALILNLATGSLILLRNPIRGDLGVLALSMFAPTAFLQTGVDVLAVVAILGSGIAATLAANSPIAGRAEAIVLSGALLTGAVTSLVLILFRDRVRVSTAWWQEACARERALREFAEGAVPQLGESVVARELAARLRHAFGTGHCAIVTGDRGRPRILAEAGLWHGGEPDGEALSGLLRALADRQPLLRADLGEASLPWAVEGGTLVALPIVLDETVAGAIVLSAAGERAVGEEDLLLWRAMAAQVGTALDSARLFARLQEALHARSEFVNTMSHELRSPLHVILGYGEMIAEGRADPQVAAGRIRANALELLQLVENTLTVGRLSGGRLALQRSEFDLQALFEELRESVGALPEARGTVSVTWRVDGDCSALHLDRLKVKEIVHNLVSNALKFTGSGLVSVRARPAGGRLRIDVEDNGPGISATDHERIFGLFERGDGDTAAGAGLGLYIVKSLAELMGGEVALTSAPGRGAHFTVWLPIRIEDR
ncbi:MAG TPA: GAF domain-containing sensor histidine kinase [Candidatus Dormibacteraeota bacterium]|nr:GAF domain-containing sensor histidine kinase [Candidatus Dormibacteraeota bacterium]